MNGLPVAPSVELRTAAGLVDYADALATMEARVASIHAGQSAELLWFVEHPPLYTAGTSARSADLLSPDRLPVFKTGRGGQYTYHGPGQRVAYLMLNLQHHGQDIRRYVHALEDWGIAALARLGVSCQRRDGRVGLWVEGAGGRDEKIAAIGVRVRHWITYHGIAINVAPDLAHYDGIVPCGIAQHGVTSLQALGLPTSLAALDAALIETFAPTFARTLVSP